jgi:hypothetical protein
MATVGVQDLRRAGGFRVVVVHTAEFTLQV